MHSLKKIFRIKKNNKQTKQWSQNKCEVTYKAKHFSPGNVCLLNAFWVAATILGGPCHLAMSTVNGNFLSCYLLSNHGHKQ
jgi:hypothetical protein